MNIDAIVQLIEQGYAMCIYQIDKIYFISIKYRMPYTMRKVPKKNCYKVYKRNLKNKTKKVFAKCSTRKNAIKQMRLLRALEYNKKFTFKKK